MKAIKKSVFLPILLLFLMVVGVNQLNAQIPDEIILSLKSGNSKVLAGFFNQNVELVILESDNVFSKAQAEQIVSNFFSRYQPEKFNVLYQGGKEGAQYVIGNLVSKQLTFRVYFLLKKTADGKDIIHHLRIEKQE